MRVAYYTQPWFLDVSLPVIRAMSRRFELHVFLELSPEGRGINWFWDPADARLPRNAGVHTLSAAARRAILPEVSAFLDNVASFSLVVHTSRRALGSASAIQTNLRAAARIVGLRPGLLHFEHVWSRTLPLFFLTPGVPKLLSIHDAAAHPGDIDTRLLSTRRRAIPRVSRLLFYSDYTRREYTRSVRAQGLTMPPASMVPLGIKEVYREWPAPDVAEREPSILFFGRLSTYKGLDVLFEALPEVARRIPGLRVVVAGQPEVGYQVPVAPRLPDGAELTLLLEPIGNVTLRRLFQQTSVVVAPYIEASQSGVVQTAFAFGKPVVASAVGGLPEAVQDGVTGVLFPPGDAPALAQALIGILLDRSARARMRAAIGELERTYFGMAPVANQLEKVWLATVKRRDPTAPGVQPIAVASDTSSPPRVE